MARTPKVTAAKAKTQKPAASPKVAQKKTAAVKEKELYANAMAGQLVGAGAVKTYAKDLYGLREEFENVTKDEYQWLYDYNGVGAKVVDIYPNYTWRFFPTVKDTPAGETTPFTEDWNALLENLNVGLKTAIKDVDKLSGIGRYGILYLGFDDGASATPQNEVTSGKLVFVRAFAETSVEIQDVDTNTKSPRCGLPVTYKVKIEDAKGAVNDVIVHWSRIIHISENKTKSPVMGTPRMQKVLMNILDHRLLTGGSCHGYMRGAFPGHSFESAADVKITDINKQLMKNEVGAYMQNQTRALFLQGVEAKPLQMQVADPDAHIMAQLRPIAMTLDIPLRIFIGSEEGKLASVEDAETWDKQVQSRQENYATDGILKPIIQRLVEKGAVRAPKGNVIVEWKREDMKAKQSQADLGVKRTTMLKTYADSPNAPNIMAEDKFMTQIMGLEQTAVEEIMREATSAAAGPAEPAAPSPVKAPAKQQAVPTARE